MKIQGPPLGDAEVRQALRLWLFQKHTGEADTVIVDELGVCQGKVRIDLAVVNGVLHGYEIKSNRDTLRRLEGQVDLYSKVLDRATIVVGDRHLSHTLTIVPVWWGILRFDQGPKGPQFKTVRRGRLNPQRDPRALVELLWLNDAMALLEERRAARGVRGKPRYMVWDRVCEHVKLQDIATAVRDKIKVRAALQGSLQR